MQSVTEQCPDHFGLAAQLAAGEWVTEFGRNRERRRLSRYGTRFSQKASDEKVENGLNSLSKS